MIGPGRRELSRGEALRIAALLALIAAAWFELPGSHLAEPDEARYAEIPREMLATGDFVTPRLNGVPYFEKPPLLYWSNSLSFALLGETPFAARLPTRLAGTATVLLLVYAIGRLRGRGEGLLAGIFLAAAPFGFTAARTNLTDGVLTAFFTATLFAALATFRRAAAGRPTAAMAAATGAFAACGFLSKGLIAIVLPGGILLAWALATKSMRAFRTLLVSPAPVVFLLLASPWLLLAERANPGFFEFFFWREHFQRFATPAASRPGPIYYFAALFLPAFLPGFFVFFRGAREAFRRDPLSLFFVLWFGVVFVFFSVSRSKLPPYLFPALPAAAALAARGLVASGVSRAPWRWHAGLAALLLVACAATPDVRRAVAENGLTAVAALGAAALLAGAAGALRARTSEAAAGAMGLGWAGLYFSLAVAWPRLPLATDVARIADEAGRAAREAGSSARVVAYRGYLQGLPWGLRATVPVADYQGELEAEWLSPEEKREIFWERSRFWEEWRSGRPLVAVLRARDRRDFQDADPSARFRLCRGKYCVVSNR